MTETNFWILTALVGGRRHGYALLQRIEELSEGRSKIKVTTLYAAVDRLTRDGLISVDGDEVVDGRHRRYFTLSTAGRAALELELEGMELRRRSARAQLGALDVRSAR